MLDGYTTVIAIAAVVILIVIAVSTGYLKQRPLPLRHEYFEQKWKEIKGLCVDKKTWPLAVINADKLVDDALKRRRYKGKTMGERLVSSQRSLSDNDAVWFGHKLRNRLVHEQDSVTLKEADVKQALAGFRRALRDLGALPK